MFGGEKSRKARPTVLDLFCGAGGMSLGFENAGCQILGGIDQNRYAIYIQLYLTQQDNAVSQLNQAPRKISSR